LANRPETGLTMLKPMPASGKRRTQKRAPVVNRAHARTAGLHWVAGNAPGLTLTRRGGTIILHDAHGRRVRDAAVMARVRALVLPPAWRNVWIAKDPKAHLQATGIDAAGRKQYRYHPAWTAARDASKYHRMLAFARVLPALRRRVARDLSQPPLSRAHVLATVVSLLERTHIRVGNEAYATENGSHGLTTLRDRHVTVRGSRVHFAFKGKSGVKQSIDLHDSKLARAIRRCQDLPGQMLFQYLDERNAIRSVTSSDVNRYLAETTGGEFTAKDFRTWAGTLAAARALDAIGAVSSKTAAARSIVRAIDEVATQLGNTRAVCRRCYIHPAVLEAFEAGVTIGALATTAPTRGLRGAERALVQLLRRSVTGRRPKAA
jgi:DNA topoisomerase-1